MTSTSPPPQSRNVFRVAIVCALPLEASMVEAVFDKTWSNTNYDFGQAEKDKNAYTVGLIGKHNVVLVHMAGVGSIGPAIALAGLCTTFPNIGIVFVVGICGASPINISTQEEICLGDCIISTALTQYDFGRKYPGYFERKGEVEESLGKATGDVRTQLAKLQALGTQVLQTTLARHLQALQEKEPKAHYPGQHKDCLFDPAYLHIHRDMVGKCDKCVDGSEVCTKDCSEIGCDVAQLIPRTIQATYENALDQRSPRLHFGRYGSANTVLKSGTDRDKHVKAENIIAFEMEAAGVWDSLPTLVVKSACDYADSHKNKEWQGYAAATAAAGLKAILEYWRCVDTSNGLDPAIQSATATSEHYTKDFKIPFSIKNLPIPKTFINRPIEMQRLQNELLPDDQNSPRKLFVLYGLGGIGKTQLAVSFVRTHRAKFSAVFWLDGSNEDSLKRSVSQLADKIPLNQIPERSRVYRTTGERNIEIVVEEVIHWLELPDNNKWLMVFDNVDRDYRSSAPDPLSYDIEKYMPTADQGSILITTRLTQLADLGVSQEVKKVDNETAKAILTSRYPISSGKEFELLSNGLKQVTADFFSLSKDKIGSRTLLERLDGHPLAIAQAGSYLCQTGMSIKKYLQLYDEQPQTVADARINEYPSDSAWTTWSISYNAVLCTDKYAANLLILWSFLDRGDLWYDLFEKAYSGGLSKQACVSLLGEIAVDELFFIKAMALLRSYSLVEGSEDSRDSEGYSMHTVVHHWMYFCHGIKRLPDFGVMALKLIGYASPRPDKGNYNQLQQRLLTHANMCWTKLMNIQDPVLDQTRDSAGFEAQITHEEIDDYLIAMNKLGGLFVDQIKHSEAEKVFMRALEGCEKASRANLTLTLTTINNLGNLYTRQVRVIEAEEIYRRAPQGYEEALGASHPLTLASLGDLGLICVAKGKLDEGENILSRALQEKEKLLGSKHMSTIVAANNLGEVYRLQCKFDRAEEMLMRVLQECKERHEAGHISTVAVLNNLGNLYRNRDRPNKAEEMCGQALQMCEELMGPKHLLTLHIVNNLGNIHADQGKHIEAEKMYMQSMQGRVTSAGGAKNLFVLMTIINLGVLYTEQDRLEEAEKMYMRAQRDLEEGFGTKNAITLVNLSNTSILYCKQGKFDEAEEMCSRALKGLEVRGIKYTSTLDAINNLGVVYAEQGKLSEAEEMFRRALQGYDKVLGAKQMSTRSAAENLYSLYRRQNKLDGAKIHMQPPQGCEKALAAELVKPSTPTSNATEDPHDLHVEAKAGKFRAMREKVLPRCKMGRGAFSSISRAWLHSKRYPVNLGFSLAEDDTSPKPDTVTIRHDLPSSDKPQPHR